MSELANLTPFQRKLLQQLSRGDIMVPYGDPHAQALLVQGLAARQVAFGKLSITPSGRKAVAKEVG